MASTSMIIQSTDTSNKKLQKTITDVNPKAQSSALKTFAEKYNALSTNNLEATYVIDKTNVMIEERPTGGGSSSDDDEFLNPLFHIHDDGHISWEGDSGCWFIPEESIVGGMIEEITMDGSDISSKRGVFILSGDGSYRPGIIWTC